MKISVEKIFRSPGQHCAFTSLVKYGGKLFCAFRVSAKHMPGLSRIVVMCRDLEAPEQVFLGQDGTTPWHMVYGTDPKVDVRDPQLLVYQDKLYLFFVRANFSCDKGPFFSRLPEQCWKWKLNYLHVFRVRIKSVGPLVWSAKGPEKVLFGDRRSYFKTDPFSFVPAGATSLWPWHFYIKDDVAHAVAYDPLFFREMTIYRSAGDLGCFNPTEQFLPASVGTSEACVLPREGSSDLYIARSEDNQFTTLGHLLPHSVTLTQNADVIHSPRLIETPRGVFCVGRSYGGRFDKPVTAIWKLNPNSLTLKRFVMLPSGGDCGYPSVVYHEGKLFVSYYSQHEIPYIGDGDNTRPSEIFIAEVDIDTDVSEAEPDPQGEKPRTKKTAA
ncbi:MAG TPA: hypothetical protein P5110_07470 [Candidatus Omnitrophota bacterium]|nr:hypothetical protein [Candidatus Omnitrophota bacterium]